MSSTVDKFVKTDETKRFSWKNMLIAGTILVLIEILLAQIVSGLGALLLLPFGFGAYVSFIIALVLSITQSKKGGAGKATTNFLISLVVAVAVLSIGGSLL